MKLPAYKSRSSVAPPVPKNLTPTGGLGGRSLPSGLGLGVWFGFGVGFRRPPELGLGFGFGFGWMRFGFGCIRFWDWVD